MHIEKIMGGKADKDSASVKQGEMGFRGGDVGDIRRGIYKKVKKGA